jgi:cytochrome c-type biogenesis protein CcmE
MSKAFLDNGSIWRRFMAMDKKKKKFIFGSLIIVCAIIYLVFLGISKTSIYYMKVDELLAKEATFYNQTVRIEGKVLAGSIKKGPSPMSVEFRITDGKKNFPVRYEGVIPDMFEDERAVVIEGIYASTGTFSADTLMTSCPSKYEEEQKQSDLKKLQKTI